MDKTNVLHGILQRIQCGRMMSLKFFGETMSAEQVVSPYEELDEAL